MENIMLESSEEPLVVKLIDFGLSKVCYGMAFSQSWSMFDLFLGTLCFLFSFWRKIENGPINQVGRRLISRPS